MARTVGIQVAPLVVCALMAACNQAVEFQGDNNIDPTIRDVLKSGDAHSPDYPADRPSGGSSVVDSEQTILLSCGAQGHNLTSLAPEGIDVPNNCVGWSEETIPARNEVDLFLALDASPNMATYADAIAPLVRGLVDALKQQNYTVHAGGLAFEDSILEVLPCEQEGTTLFGKLSSKASPWFQSLVGPNIPAGQDISWMSHDAPNVGLTAIEQGVTQLRANPERDKILLYMSNAPAKGANAYSSDATAAALTAFHGEMAAQQSQVQYIYVVSHQRLQGMSDTFATSAAQADLLFSRAGVPAEKFTLPPKLDQLVPRLQSRPDGTRKQEVACLLSKVAIFPLDSDEKELFVKEFSGIQSSGSTRIQPADLPPQGFRLVISRTCGTTGVFHEVVRFATL